MPITITYDLTGNVDNNQRTYIRSMLERFGWQRLGGTVFRYNNPNGEEDWLNQVIPSLMFFRSYVLANGIKLKTFTLDAQSVTYIDHSDPAAPLGNEPLAGSHLPLQPPTNPQSAEKTIRQFVDAATGASR